MILTEFQRKLLEDLRKHGAQNLVSKHLLVDPRSDQYKDYNKLTDLGLIEPAGGGKDKITKAGEKALNN